MYLIITIDTEGDNAWAGKGLENQTQNARYLPRFHRLCSRYGFKPTYLTTYEMANDGYFLEFARSALAGGECEIGAHPHPWNQPPEYAITSDDYRARPYLIEYPPHIIEDKVRRLTDVLGERFETPIRSHRAGRWAFNATYARVLASLGFTVDCSVTPHDRATVLDRPGPEPAQVPLPDYRDFPDRPYFLDADDISRSGDLPVLEIPMTIVPNYGSLLERIYWTLPLAPARRLMRGFLGQPVMWFRPTRRNRKAMFRVAERQLASDADYLMFMLHSSELMPGCNPTFVNYHHIEKLYDLMEMLFEWLRDRGVTGATCSEYREHFVRTRPQAARAARAG